MTQPTYLAQGISYPGFLSKQLGDLRGITSLAHELIQNADDAKDDDGNLAATQISFDFRDDALIVSNNAVFREIDFERIQDVASGTKRYESGARTTGAFGVGFISVYQITDEPEIRSAGRRWTLRPDQTENQRIQELEDPSITEDKGTVIKLPWAFEDSEVRSKLKVSPVKRGSIDSLLVELKESLPKAILFLKKLDTIELRRNGKPVSRVEKPMVEGSERLIECDGSSRVWRVLQGSFDDSAPGLRRRFASQIENSRSCHVRVAIPDSPLCSGLLYATLPTKHSTGLPFHIDADFFPTSDRNSIAFEDVHDHRSEWNRAAIMAVSSVVSDNLIPLRDMFKGNAKAFWSLLGRLHHTHEAQSNEREPLGAIWETLLPSLKNSPIVHTESRKWLNPVDVLITTGETERAGLPAFGALGIEMVHQDLMSYRNILTSTSNGVGVQTLSVEDIYKALDSMGMVGQVLNDRPLRDDLLKSLWTGIQGLLGNTHSTSAKQQAHELLRKCALAPSIDGRLWPCGYVYRANDATRRIFANLVADDVSFLAVERIPLLERVCPQFTVNEAIEELGRQDSLNIQSSWQSGKFRPRDLLRWFDDEKSSLTGDLRERLAQLPIFPSAGKLRPLANLYLPGGFDDPIGVAVLVDMEQLKGLSDFLESLGAKKLDFQDYAISYIPDAFADDSAVSLENKRGLLKILETRIGEIRANKSLWNKLANAKIVECVDGGFKQPRAVYFRNHDVSAVSGNQASYASLPEESESRCDLYRWLGVQDHPRPEDVLQRINELAAIPPDVHIRKSMVKVLKTLGDLWTNLPDGEKGLFWPLKDKEWLPAEGDHTKWYRPHRLHAIYNKSLFASQAKFLDVPSRIQQQARDFLDYLKVNLSPQPFQVVRHLLACSQRDEPPPNGVYRWLNDNAQSNHLLKLQSSACLRIRDKYLRPDQVFWGPHHFGRFRTQLSSDFLQFQALLSALDIRDAPNHIDAIQVMKEISEEVGNRKLESNEKDVVFHCWAILAEALQNEELDAGEIESSLKHTPCVPNPQNKLYPPLWMVLEDRPGLAEEFAERLRNNWIPRLGRAWPAMKAAGVRPVSTVVVGSIVEPLNAPEDEMLKNRIAERKTLIKTLLEGMRSHDQLDAHAIQFDSIRFFRTDKLKVRWYLKDFPPQNSPPSPPRPVSAYLNRKDRSIYFTCPNGNTDWAAIARELTLAIAPGEEIKSISPGIKVVLEAHSHDHAIEQLKDLGIPVTEELSYDASGGSVAESFEEAPRLAQPQEPPTPSQDGFNIAGVPDETQQVEQNEPAESDSTSVDSEEDAHPPAGSTTTATGIDRGGVGGSHGGRHSTDETTRNQIQPEDKPPTSAPKPVDTDEAEEPFAKRFFEVQTVNPSAAAENPVWLPQGGPKTEESAKRHTTESGRLGRSEARVPKIVTRSELGPQGKALADEFRNMVHGDYGKRCQICSRSFTTANGESQVFVVHVVPPRADHRTNHFGDLLGLCGWHYALVRYGEWVFLNPETHEPFRDPDQMTDIVLNACKKIDDNGNPYIAMPVRFWNVYRQWRADPEPIDEEIRFSIPHWTYFCELLKT